MSHAACARTFSSRVRASEEPQLNLIGDLLPGGHNVLVVRGLGGMRPEVVAGPLDPDDRQGHRNAVPNGVCTPWVDFTVHVQDAATLRIDSAVHQVGEGDARFCDGAWYAKHIGAEAQARVKGGNERLRHEWALASGVASLVEAELCTSLPKPRALGVASVL